MTENCIATLQDTAVEGTFIQIDGQDYYEIENYDRMSPFLMSIVSSGDHWMYVSSSGGLTAGRVSPENCLFPYVTVDQLHDCHHYTGPVTAIRSRSETRDHAVWQPFINGVTGTAVGPRRLRKHVVGDEVVFEEVHEQLELLFQYRWRTSAKYGFVRTATLKNTGTRDTQVELIDGIQNICPSGVPLATYQRTSCLVDAYKHNEFDSSTGLAIFSLTAQILDRAEAAEVLRATTAWSRGLPDPVVILSHDTLQAFFRGATPLAETLCTGQRGNFFVFAPLQLGPGQSHSWYLVGDVGRSHRQVASIRQQLLGDSPIEIDLEKSIQLDRQNLVRNVASADGLQKGGSQMAATHHFANVLFNNMRGGVPAENYLVDSRDFATFLAHRNRDLAAELREFLRALPEQTSYQELLARADGHDLVDLKRLAMEYLPLTFGRRHGDPSRPWNSFEIIVQHEDGSKVFSYQGNWRDIFQNWEALCTSFPLFLPSVVAKFVNASTVDGFNPYRVTSDGIDWEVPDPDVPWNNIGYWGDHQIIYLTKLLEALLRYFPGALTQMLEQQVFCYANIPYRIRPYDEILRNSSETIDYDTFTATEIERRVDALGTDGKLTLDSQGKVYHTNLVEKLLVPVLAKLSNLVVDGGIWLNTQRPEWNDANNALVGSGLSMVTVCYLRRHMNLLIRVLKEKGNGRFSISVEVEQWFRRIRTVLQENRAVLNQTTIADQDRGRLLEELGRAFSDYRLKVYEDGFSGRHTIATAELVGFFQLAIEYLDHSIRSNRRDDCLYHAYNLIKTNTDRNSVEVKTLYKMLEGQVAVLSSGVLDTDQAIELVDALFDSDLYRADQQSFILYPERRLPGFLERNKIDVQHLESSELLRELVSAEDQTIVVPDAFGDYHFQHTIEKRAELVRHLDRLALDEHWSDLVAKDRQLVLDLFEELFSHASYTGRSGTMYAYEGLGSIYWHMVAKLLLAIQENILTAVDKQASKSMIESLTDFYYLVRGGLSSDKTPAQYGAFPSDPYSHTPKHRGAQQPGMTGQVKEEILTRQGELGVRVIDGRVHFQPLLLRRREFAEHQAEFSYYDVAGEEQTMVLPPTSLAFTLCQVPVVYQLAEVPFSTEVSYSDGRKEVFQDGCLDKKVSEALFHRRGDVRRIDVQIPAEQLLRA